MAKPSKCEICQRIRQLRIGQCGSRGKSAFAALLGLSPSTYDYYENSRVPPADVLLRIADVTGADLRWLITGQAGQDEVGASNPVIRRAVQLLRDHPQAQEPLAAFMDILAQSLKFPAKTPTEQGGGPDTQADEPATALRVMPHSPVDMPKTPDPRRLSWIPLLGRSAAGVPQFWANADEVQAVLALGELVARNSQRVARDIAPAIAQTSEGSPCTSAQDVQIITVDEPDDLGVCEFIAAPRIKERLADAFAVRIDGESMSPDIRHGDLVILSPSVEAQNGRAAVVQLQGQIGVTCKIYRRSGKVVHLVPANGRFTPQSFDAAQIVWALRVLARVRPK